MTDVFSVLGADHDKVLATLTRLQGVDPASATLADDVEELVMDESRHEAVEELYFWPMVRARVPGGDELADRALEQEQMAKQMLEALEAASGGAQAELLQGFTAAAREHISFEQDQVWPKLRPALSEVEAEELGNKLEQAKASAPTRPHSHTPPSPAVQKAAGPAVAAVDRIRDAITGRG